MSSAAAQRQHSFADAEQEFYGLQQAYKSNGYEVILIPKMSVQERTDFIEQMLLHRSAGMTPFHPAKRS
jgi:predicted ATPase